jgi:hypothetical protein
MTGTTRQNPPGLRPSEWVEECRIGAGE